MTGPTHAAAHSCAGTRKARSLRIARLVASLGLVALAWACGPVYIPVPPPTQTTFTLDTLTDSSGTPIQVWTAAGGPEPRAANGTYYVFDQDRNAGVIAGARDDGSYQAPAMPGTAGDHILINYAEKTGKLSSTACLILSEQRPTAAVCP